jgi:transcriptional regulator with XRE-family HTH domain
MEITEFDTTVAGKIRSERDERDLSQAAFARALGISRQTLSGWEAQRTRPTLDTWRRVRDIAHRREWAKDFAVDMMALYNNVTVADTGDTDNAQR